MRSTNEFSSVKYYSNINSVLSRRKSNFFNTGRKDLGGDYVSDKARKEYIREGIISKATKLFTLLLLVTVISFLSYICFSYFVSVL